MPTMTINEANSGMSMLHEKKVLAYEPCLNIVTLD